MEPLPSVAAAEQAVFTENPFHGNFGPIGKVGDHSETIRASIVVAYTALCEFNTKDIVGQHYQTWVKNFQTVGNHRH